MADNRMRYREFERFLTTIVFAALALFIVYLVSASFGWGVLKIVCAVLAIILSLFGLWNLYSSKELMKARSLWLTYSYGSLILCTVVSLLCNFPRH